MGFRPLWRATNFPGTRRPGFRAANPSIRILPRTRSGGTQRDGDRERNHERRHGMKQVLQDRSGLTVVRDVPPPACARGAVLVRNSFSAISSGTERARVALSKKSLLAKARERPDLARQVLDR